MPFRPAIRWSTARPQAKAFAADVQRLCSDTRVHRIFEWFGRHEREIAELQLAITAIPAPSFGEQARAAWFRERLQPLGLALSTDAAGNLLGVRPGLNSAAACIAISAHLDTVFPAATVLNIRREHATLCGPGISDNGAGLAALWALAAAFHHAEIRTSQPLLFTANVCEEGEGNLRGIRHLYRERLREQPPDPLLPEGKDGAPGDPVPPPQQANIGLAGDPAPPPQQANIGLAGDPAPSPQRANIGLAGDPAPSPQQANSGLAGDPAPQIAMLIALDGAGTSNIISEGLGSRRFEITISGPGGHSWSDHGVPNPLIAASLTVAALSRIPLSTHPRATLNVGSIEGGTSVNAIPARAVIKVDVRSSHPGHLDNLEQQLRRAVAQGCAEAQAHASGGRLQSTIALIGSRPAGELPASSPLLAAIRAVDAQLGIQSQTQIASTDANIPLSLGLEAVSLGAGGNGGGAHTIGEWFDPAGREQALQRLALLILVLAGHPPDTDSSLQQAKSGRAADPETE